MGRSVAIVYKTLPHYRVAFFEQLRGKLSEDGIELRLIVGQPVGEQVLKRDSERLPWAEYVPSRYLRLGRRHVLWQPVWMRVRGSDLVVVEQASRLLVNYWLMLMHRVGAIRLAMWGHGLNRNPGNSSRMAEAIKRFLLRECDWWFGYSPSTVKYLVERGVPPARITNVENATDTAALFRWRQAQSADSIEARRTELGLGAGPVLLMLGSLYEEKRPRFAFEVIRLMRLKGVHAELLVIGDGPLREELERDFSKADGVHFLGVKKGKDLVEFAGTCAAMLNPGLVGLSILDSFALGLPIVTSHLPYHSPEIDFLDDGVNGILLPESSLPEDFANRILTLLEQGGELERLRRGCLESASRYTVESMVENFRMGVLQCLSGQ